MRLAILVSHPIQHFAPWHRELAKLPEMELKVFFFTDWGMSGLRDPGFNTELKWDVPLIEGYDHEFLLLKHPLKEIDAPGLDNPTVGAALDRFQPDVVKLFGYSHRTSWRVARWAKAHRRPLLLYSDSNIKAQTFWKNIVKRPVVRFFYSHVDGALSVGDNNYAYHRSYGIPTQRLFQGCLPVDCERILKAVPDVAAARNDIRRKYGIPDNAFVVMFCGKFTAGKLPLDVIKACLEASKKRFPVWSFMVGEGVLRPEMEHYCRHHSITNTTLTGFVNQAAIPNYYAASDVLVVSSSQDSHPLVVTEASAFGLPIIASDAIGCIGNHDTARPGVNTLVYRCGNVAELQSAIQSLYENKDLYNTLSSGGREIAKTQDVKAAAEQLSYAATKLYEMGKR